MTDLRRFDVGLQDGASISVRAEPSAYNALVTALTGDDGDRWHSLETDDSLIVLDLAQVVYVRRERGDQRVGF